MDGWIKWNTAHRRLTVRDKGYNRDCIGMSSLVLDSQKIAKLHSLSCILFHRLFICDGLLLVLFFCGAVPSLEGKGREGRKEKKERKKRKKERRRVKISGASSPCFRFHQERTELYGRQRVGWPGPATH